MTKVIYIADPLCGWCWGAAPAVSAVHQTALESGAQFELVHRAFFTGEMTRWMSNSFSDYVIEADKRIQAVSGQPFSDTYKENLLYNASLIFDSWPTAIAIQAVKQLAPDVILQYFECLQNKRFIEGRVITDASVLTEVATEAGIKPIDFHSCFTHDEAMQIAAKQEQRHAITLQNQVLSQGVPCLLLEKDGSRVRLPHESWLGDPHGFASVIQHQLQS